MGAWWRAGIGFAVATFAADAAARDLAVAAAEDAAGARLTVSWDATRTEPAPTVTARLEGGALVVQASEPMAADPAAIARGAPSAFALARLEGDRRRLRVVLRRAAEPVVTRGPSAFVVALPAPPPPPAREAAPGAGPVGREARLDVGEREDFTRLTFTVPGGARVTPTQTGDRLDLRFSRPIDVDVAPINVNPPRFVTGARQTSRPGQPLAIALTLAPGTRHRHFTEGDRVVVDLLAPAPPASDQREAERQRPAATPAAAPQGGTLRVELAEEAAATRFRLRWNGPVRAAAFRRGEAVWLVFDAETRLAVDGLPQVGRRHRSLRAVQGPGYTALRIGSPGELLISARAEGPVWTFSLAERAERPAAVARVDREQDEQGIRLAVRFARDGVVRWVEDPEVGDRMAVALVPGPAIGVDVRRSTVEAAVLPAAHGVAVETRADGVGAAFQDGALVVSREAGLIGSASGRLGDADQPPPPALSGVGQLDLVSWGFSEEPFRVAHARLQKAAAEEGVEEGAPITARITLARFLLAYELAHEALGALRLAAVGQPALELNPEYRLMRAAANLMIGRRAPAERDLALGALADDPTAALWRGYAAALAENWPEARRQFERGRTGMALNPPSWRVRFNLALGEAALRLNDLPTAESAIRAAQLEAPTRDLHARAELLRARLLRARGDTVGALKVFDGLSTSRDEFTAVRASLEAVRTRRELNQMTPAAAVDVLEGLRFRWRGDGLEMEIIQTLGLTYTEMGRWREGLTVMRAAANRYGDQPTARAIRLDMAAIFDRLYLQGMADSIEPIQSLGLFYEFRDLTPFGPDGDRMIRLLAGRLVEMDLLEQAADLLTHQVDNRLEGIGRAMIATDLAAVFLEDRKPEQALAALARTRQSNLPPEVVGERRILEARALMQLGRFDHALELLERDRSEAAQRLRVDVAWRRRDWPAAATEIGRLLDLTDTRGTLSPDQRNLVLRAAAAMVFNGDQAGLDRLRRTFAARMQNTPDEAAFEVVAGATDAGSAALADAARRIARTDLIERFMADFRRRLRAGLPPGEAAPAEQTPPPAPAPTPASNAPA